jgi:hypothetical protein
VGLPNETVYAAVFSQLRWSALLSSLALTSAFGIAWMLSGRIVRPLRSSRKTQPHLLPESSVTALK